MIPCNLPPQFGIGSVSPILMIVVPSIDDNNIMIDIPISEQESIVLTEYLKKAELYNSTYITALVKCGKLQGNVKNAKICYSWLEEEINVFKPKHVLFLGKSMKKFYEKLSFDSKSLFDCPASELFRAKLSIRNEFLAKLMEIKNKCLISQK